MLKNFKKIIYILSIIILPSSAFASEKVSANEANIALNGYDVVAYFTSGIPMRGYKSFSVEYKGAEFRFIGRAHYKKFVENPQKYMPQFGGFCAMGVAMGKKLESDPLVWTIKDNKLYLNLDPKVQETWFDKVDEYIEQAEANWLDIETVPAEDLNVNF